MKAFDRKLVLEDGTVFLGYAFGSTADKICEVVFNTSPVGYQEILSDPSYTDQAVVMAYPLIGNYGMATDDYETMIPTIGALIVRDYNDLPSNFRAEETLGTVMQRFDISGIAGVDTRKLVRHIRDHGACRGILTTPEVPTEEALERIAKMPVPHDAVSRVSRDTIMHYVVPHSRYHVVAVDCGMKQNIVRSLLDRGCSVTIVPYNTTAETVKALRPSGLFVSNGPGDPEDVTPVIQLLQDMRGQLPIFGICLGHQMIALSYGAKTYKLKFGHRGGNHPVRNLKTGHIEMTSQNHSYAVDTESLKGTPLTATHMNILDNTVEGMECLADKVFSVQYHPESAPGPQDSAYLFDQFIQMMGGEQHA